MRTTNTIATAKCGTCGDTADRQLPGFARRWAEGHARERQHVVALALTTTTTWTVGPR